MQLEMVVSKLSAQDVDLREWNDALHCIAGRPPETSAKLAKSQLIKWLRQKRAHLRKYDFIDQIAE